MGKKTMKRKLGKLGYQILSGKITPDEALARLCRKVPQQGAYKSAWSTWPESVSLPRPAVPDENYVLEAVRAKIPVPVPASAPAVTKKRKAARPGPVPAWQQVLNKAFADDAGVPPGAYRPAPLPPVVVKQLSQPERAMVAGLEQQLARVAHDPARREEIKDQIARITGLPYAGVV